jgi:hypothetical protein
VALPAGDLAGLAVRQLPSTANASSSLLSAGLEYQAGVNPSRNLMLAASENDPRGTSVNVSMPQSHHAPLTFPLATALASSHRRAADL